jgi:hypothetical protein
LFYYATLDVAARLGNLTGTIHVALVGCDHDVADQDEGLLGYNGCGSTEPADEDPNPGAPPDPLPPQWGNGPIWGNGPQWGNGRLWGLPLPWPWVDPSGTVYARTAHGPLVPLARAKVVLRRSESRHGRFSQVPRGSATMSPANRRNPDRTSLFGSFGWDVLPGFYTVTASHRGCRSRSDGRSAKTRTLRVPPPAVRLRLVLRCPHLQLQHTRITLHVARQAHGMLSLRARVRGSRPHGTVTFRRGRRVIAVVPVDPDSGEATVMIRIARRRGFKAAYGGDGRNAASTTAAP